MRTIMLMLCGVTAFAETRTLTLRQALDLALQQNPDLVIARLDQERARFAVTIARDPFPAQGFRGQRRGLHHRISGQHRWRGSRLFFRRARRWRFSTSRSGIRSPRPTKICVARRSTFQSNKTRLRSA